jgi:hypothetical protein
MRGLVLLLAFAAVVRGQDSLALLTHFDNPPSPNAVSAMREELSRILRPAGLRLEWRGLEDAKTAIGLPPFVLLSFRGVCATGDEPEASDGAFRLGTTEMSDGRVLPFTKVQCNQIREVVPEARDRALGIAMARVVAHEVYHVLLQTSAHAKAGIAKARHTRADLTGAGIHFDAASIRALLSRTKKRRDPQGAAPALISRK